MWFSVPRTDCREFPETPEVESRMLDDIVIEWENEYNQLLADIKERMQKKEASDEDAQQVVNLERIVLIYDLMMKNAVEYNGFWPHEGRPVSRDDSLRKLADRISPSVDATPEMLASTLGHALREGNLTVSDKNGNIRWQWKDRLEPRRKSNPRRAY